MNFNLEYFLDDNNISYKKTKVDDSTRFDVTCFFDENHKNRDAAFYLNDNGSISYYCFHDSCKGNNFKSVINLFKEKNIDMSKYWDDIKENDDFLKNDISIYNLNEIKIEKNDWVVKNLIGYNKLTCIFGDPASGKSFYCLDMALSIANNLDFYDKKIKRNKVLYIAAEGASTIKLRAIAWSKNKKIQNSNNFNIITKPLSFSDADTTSKFINKIKDDPPDIIFIDTLARTFGSGDESSTKDMNNYIHNLDKIRYSTNSAIVLIHHTGHSEKHRARGSIALNGALDFEYRVEKNDDIIRITDTKQKDAKSGSSLGTFRLETFNTDILDEDEEYILSASLIHVDENEFTIKPPTGINQKKIYQYFLKNKKKKIFTKEEMYEDIKDQFKRKKMFNDAFNSLEGIYFNISEDGYIE